MNGSSDFSVTAVADETRFFLPCHSPLEGAVAMADEGRMGSILAVFLVTAPASSTVLLRLEGGRGGGLA